MHDPRVGRFFAVDPLTAKYPYYTPYSFSGNKVIAFIELEGLEEFSFKEHLTMNPTNPVLGTVHFLADWYEDKAETKVNAAGRGLDKMLKNIAPIRPSTPEENQQVEDDGGAWMHIKKTINSVPDIPKNLYKAGESYINTLKEGTLEEKIESSVEVTGTIIATVKGKKPNITNMVQAGFNAKTGIVSFINRIKNIKIEVKLPEGFEKVTLKGSKADVFKRKGANEWITPDLDSHIGGIWKKALGKAENLLKKETREGTFNADLSKKIGE